MAKAADVATKAAEAHSAWREGIKDFRRDLALATGDLDKYDVAGERYNEQIDAAAAPPAEAPPVTP
jgi:hypothetical protein